MYYLARRLAERLKSVAEFFPVVVLTGARQTGKTTLLRATFPGHHYVSLDLPSEAKAAEADPEGFLRRHPPPVLVDEVQYAPGLFRHVKRAVDAGGNQPGRFVLTGSQQFALMQSTAESLAGRAAVLDLHPLSAWEIRAADPANRLLADPAAVIHRGFFPALWRQPELPSAEFYASYVATYLERDLRVALDVGNLADFERFMRLCAARTGQLLNKTALARDAGISTKTTAAWLSALQACNQVTLVPPWHGNLSKQLVKSPKLYFNDPGLCAFLMGLGLGAVRSSPWSGALWETAVCAELRKVLSWRATSETLHFYRDTDGVEVDFVVGTGVQLDLVECKWTETPTARDATAMQRCAEWLGRSGRTRVRSQTVACRTPAPFPLAPNCQAVNGLELAARWLG
jgi:predicted AAA+ superfamily ATPase